MVQGHVLLVLELEGSARAVSQGTKRFRTFSLGKREVIDLSGGEMAVRRGELWM